MNKLEATNYRVNSDWREIKSFYWYVDWEKTKIKAKVNKEWDIREYISWMPTNLIWEQLFTWNAVVRLWLEKRLPKYEDFKDLKTDIFPGYWGTIYDRFYNLNKRADCWLADGYDIEITKDNINHNFYNPQCGFSVRLVKEVEQYDDSSIWLFEQIVERAENNWAKLWAKAWYELGKILDSKQTLWK